MTNLKRFFFVHICPFPFNAAIRNQSHGISIATFSKVPTNIIQTYLRLSKEANIKLSYRIFLFDGCSFIFYDASACIVSRRTSSFSQRSSRISARAQSQSTSPEHKFYHIYLREIKLKPANRRNKYKYKKNENNNINNIIFA